MTKKYRQTSLAWKYRQTSLAWKYRQTSLAWAMALVGVLTLTFTSACASAADAPPPLSAFKDCETCPEMIALPAGQFMMGGQINPHKYNTPTLVVTLAKPFAIGKYEVTFDQWQACVAEHGCINSPDDHGWGKGTRPVMNITWHEAHEYTQWLSTKTGHTYRLLSEAEWEYAARAGTRSAFSWGNDVGVNQANCRNCGPEISHQTEPVGSFAPNPWGLFDMHGNVWEWTQDCWNKTLAGAPADGSVRTDGDCRQRVMRSGSWYYFSKNLMSAWRFKNDSRVRSYGIGFRVARDLP